MLHDTLAGFKVFFGKRVSDKDTSEKKVSDTDEFRFNFNQTSSEIN